MPKLRKSYVRKVTRVVVIECFGPVISPYQDDFDGKVLTTLTKNVDSLVTHSAIDGEFLFAGELKKLLDSYERFDGEQVKEELFLYVSNHKSN